MFTIAFVLTFAIACLGERDIFCVASGLFAIASAIESFTYKYFKNR